MPDPTPQQQADKADIELLKQNPLPVLKMLTVVRTAVEYFQDSGDTGSDALNKAVRAYLKEVNRATP